MSSKLAWRLLLALAVAGVLPACGNVNDDKVAIIFTDRASLDSSGAEHSGDSAYPSLSSEGRYVAFVSRAALVEGVTLNRAHIYRRDTWTGSTILISAPDSALLGSEADDDSFTPSISGDGNRIAFMSPATNLVATDTNGMTDIFVRDVQAGTTVRASQISGGGESFPFFLGTVSPAISRDGAFVAFCSDAADLDPNVTMMNPGLNVFRHELATLITRQVSVSTSGGEPDPQLSDSLGPSISATGQFISFHSNATNLIGTDANGTKFDVFVADMNALATPISLVSRSEGGTQSDENSQESSVSGDGRFVAFASFATNLDTNLFPSSKNVYRRDITGNKTTLISKNSSGAQGAADAELPEISADGRYVVFLSISTNLVDGDTNNQHDAFWRDVAGGITYRVSVRTGGGQASLGARNSNTRVAISHDGRFAAFSSRSADLVTGDTNGTDDIFTRGPLPTGP